MTKIQRAASVIPALVVAFLSPSAFAQQDEAIGWSITPYMWASDTALDLTVQDTEIGGGVEIPFSDLVDVLETAIQVHVEGGKGSWSGFVDFTYIETSDTVDRPLVNIETNSKQTVIDAAVAYWPEGTGSQLSFFGGVRYTGFDDRYDFVLDADPLVTRRSTEDFFDALLGVRYRFDLSERWSLLTRGDFSFGDSEGSWLAHGLFAYTVGKRQQNRILFGYQYKAAEFRDGGLNSDYVYSGPIAGFNFRF